MRSLLCTKSRLGLFIFIIVIGLIVRMYWANQKEGMHIDEVASFSIAECDGAYYSPDVKIDDKMRATGMELRSLYFIHDPRVKGVLHDLRYMWHNVYDYNHTNFYYSILRVFFAGPVTTDIKTIQMRGIILNMLLYVLSFIVFFKLLLLYYKDDILAIFTTLFCFSLMVGGISDTLFIRPYSLQMLMVLLLAYWITKMVNSMVLGVWKYNVKVFLITSVLLAGVLLTGYFMVILVAVFGLFLYWWIYKYNYFKGGWAFYACSLLFALAICWMCYQSYFLGFDGDQRITNKVSGSGSIMRLLDSILTWALLVMHNTLYIPVLLLLAVIAIKYRGYKIPYIFYPAFVYTFVVMLLAPYKTNRYMVAASPLLLLVIPAAVSSVRNTGWKRIAASLIVVVYMVMPMFESNIDNLYKKTPVLSLLQDKSGQVHVIHDVRWKIGVLLPSMADDVVYDISDVMVPENIKSGDVVFTTDSLDLKAERKNHALDYQYKGKCNYYHVYKVR